MRALALPDPGTERLREAMRYSVLGGGKRLRPLSSTSPASPSAPPRSGWTPRRRPSS